MDINQKDLLVTLADANFVTQAKQLFSSVYFNAGWEGDYLLLACGISEADLNWFRAKGILVYERPFLADSPLGVKAYPPIVLSKLYLFKEYFKSWSKIIFLDADIIVQASLDDLLNLTGFNAPKAETFRLRHEFIVDKNKNKEIRKKYNFRALAFNTGILVFDSKLIKEDTYSELIALYNQYKDLYQYQEESALNLFFYQKWNRLPITYNSAPAHMSYIYKINKNKLLAIVIHFFCEKIKPWDSQSLYYEEWSNNLRKAEKIDLQKRPAAAGTIGAEEQRRYLRKLKRRRIFYFPSRLIDHYIGQIGLLIKKINPKLYELIRLKKDEKQ